MSATTSRPTPILTGFKKTIWCMRKRLFKEWKVLNPKRNQQQNKHLQSNPKMPTFLLLLDRLLTPLMEFAGLLIAF